MSETNSGSVGKTKTQYLNLTKPLHLDCGTTLYPVQVAYETYGTLSPTKDNAILVCHALSGDAHAAGISIDPIEESSRDGFRAEERDNSAKPGLGWWDGMIGPGKAFDTNRYFVISTNLLGGCRGTTGPSSINPATQVPYGSDFPVITVADMVHTERAFLDELGINSLVAVAGGSLGGMQALEWALLYPSFVTTIIPIATTHALNPQGIAWNAIARSAIMTDPNWNDGHYYGTQWIPKSGMAIARMVGHMTYLSAESIADKFGRRLQESNEITYQLNNPEYAIESYLQYQANKFVTRFDANTYLYTSRALSYFDLAKEHGSGSLEKSVEKITAKTLLICFSSDWLYPPENSRALADALAANKKRVEIHEIITKYGHDSFLLEEERQTPMIKAFLSK